MITEMEMERISSTDLGLASKQAAILTGLFCSFSECWSAVDHASSKLPWLMSSSNRKWVSLRAETFKCLNPSASLMEELLQNQVSTSQTLDLTLLCKFYHAGTGLLELYDLLHCTKNCTNGHGPAWTLYNNLESTRRYLNDVRPAEHHLRSHLGLTTIARNELKQLNCWIEKRGLLRRIIKASPSQHLIAYLTRRKNIGKLVFSLHATTDSLKNVICSSVVRAQRVRRRCRQLELEKKSIAARTQQDYVEVSSGEISGLQICHVRTEDIDHPAGWELQATECTKP